MKKILILTFLLGLISCGISTNDKSEIKQDTIKTDTIKVDTIKTDTLIVPIK